MALRDQPYLPLYIQDFLTDEKLIECSASSTGIYIRLMCIMHKSEEYGTILLKQKDKQSSEPLQNFASKIAKQLPYTFDEVYAGLDELISEGVIIIDGDKLFQKRMVRDNEISEIRSEAGKKGGLKTQRFAKAKVKANSEYENENEDINKEENKGAKKFNFDFVEEQFKDVFNSWLQYKKERKETYKTQTSLEACYRNLKKLSDNNPEKANAIVEYSFANNYSGLFPLKNNTPFTPIPIIPHFSSGPDK